MAETSDSSVQATNTLETFLTAIKSEDFTTAVSLESDSRINKSDLKEWLEINNQNEEEQLKSYKIIETKESSSDKYTFITNLEFKDGSSSQVPFSVKKEDNKLVVDINDNSLTTEDYKINRSTKNTNRVVADKELVNNAKKSNSKKSEKSVQPNSLYLGNWNFTGLAGTIYSSASFTINTSNSLAELYLTQNCDYYEPNVTYSVVQKHWYGDDVWGNCNVSGNVYAQSYTMSGKSTYFSGAQVKIVFNAQSYGSLDGSGSIYN